MGYDGDSIIKVEGVEEKGGLIDVGLVGGLGALHKERPRE